LTENPIVISPLQKYSSPTRRLGVVGPVQQKPTVGRVIGRSTGFPTIRVIQGSVSGNLVIFDHKLPDRAAVAGRSAVWIFKP